LEDGWLVLEMPGSTALSELVEVSRLAIHRIPTRD